MRLAKNYALVLDVVRSAGRGAHRSAADIYAETRKKSPGIGFSTVQRGLGRLVDLGLAMRVYIPGIEGALYEMKAEKHAHFSCRNCSRTVDIDYALPVRTVRTLAERHDVAIEDESLMLVGLCNACRRKQKKGGGGV